MISAKGIALLSVGAGAKSQRLNSPSCLNFGDLEKFRFGTHKRDPDAKAARFTLTDAF
jgi:hypothetical protein